jgi:Icc-related predicted phosphoesterase
VDVLVTHAPPRGIGDADDVPHRGFDALAPLAGRLDVGLHVHGHVAPPPGGSREHRAGRTIVRNVSGHHVLEIEPVAARPQPEGDRRGS